MENNFDDFSKMNYENFAPQQRKSNTVIILVLALLAASAVAYYYYRENKRFKVNAQQLPDTKDLEKETLEKEEGVVN